MSDATFRPIDYARDVDALNSFLSERDRMRLAHCEAAVRDNDCFIIVADDDGQVSGWVVVHTNFRRDQDWEPDPDSERFQQGENAYVENIEVTARKRSTGIGRQLMEAAQDEARIRGKKFLWLHTSENNAMAHKVFEREGWKHETTVYPPWKPGSRTRIYKKEL
ncbi:MAG TPA: GNAT family N-acetyltransferase [Dehalococcoidia bacterium]|jgi:GNAT superfamily N-acetyltransferase